MTCFFIIKNVDLNIIFCFALFYSCFSAKRKV